MFLELIRAMMSKPLFKAAGDCMIYPSQPSAMDEEINCV
jgi:hypothetical protein